MTDLPYVAVDIRLLVLVAQILGALRLFLKRQALCYLREPFFLESNLLGGQANKLGALAGALKPRNATAHCTLQYKPKKITSLWLNSIGL